MKRTEKRTANSRQKSMANSRQKSRANSRQGKKKKGYDRETRHRGKLQPASPEASKNRCRCPAGHYELKLGDVITTITKIDFDEEVVEYKKVIQTAQKQRHRKPIWIDKKLIRSCIQHESGPRTKSRMSSTAKVGAT